jgi:hypothetical protein
MFGLEQLHRNSAVNSNRFHGLAVDWRADEKSQKRMVETRDDLGDGDQMHANERLSRLGKL